MTTINELLVGVERLADLTTFIHNAVHEVLIAGDGHCKHYEGTVCLDLPSFFEMQEKAPQVILKIACYVIGPGRSNSWSGNNVAECIDKAISDIERWIEEEEDHEG